MSSALFFLLCGVASFFGLLEARDRGHEVVVVLAALGVLLALAMVALALRAANNLRRSAAR